MNPLKDNSELSIKNKAHDTSLAFTIPNYYHLAHHEELVESVKKSEKIAQALHIITGLVGSNEPLVVSLRKLSLEIMQKLYRALACSQSDQGILLSEAMIQLFELQSLLKVMSASGKISHMNLNLLLNEVSKLYIQIEIVSVKALPYDRQARSSKVIEEFSFTEDFFEIEKEIPRETSVLRLSQQSNHRDFKKPLSSDIKDNNKNFLKDTSTIIKDKNNQEKKHVFYNLSTNQKTESHPPTPSLVKVTKQIPKKTERDERQENILKILKQKKDAKIGDLALLMSDVNQKTIQRDLNDLVEQGLVIKMGERRWSVYNLTY